MKNKLFLMLALCCTFLIANAQIPDGAIAPNFTALDINGQEVDLYEILASNKDVIIDFSATWCPPCWAFHETKTLEDLYAQVGPDGTDEAVILHVECDSETTIEDLRGETSGSMGDWITGVDYPILDNSEIATAYKIGAYPTIMKICADRRVENIGRISVEQYQEQLSACPSVEYGSEAFFRVDRVDGCGELEVQFTGEAWPPTDSWLWDFGDGNTSTEQSPMHNYTTVGNYNVSLSVANQFGESTEIKEDFISVGVGVPRPDEAVGPLDKDIGSGRYFEGGHHALIFSTYEDMVITSVKVFAETTAERTITLTDELGNLLNTKTVMIPAGEQRVSLEFFVPEGTDFQLGMGSDAYLFRNDGGVTYPYEIDNLMSITRSTATTTPLNYYYYFYDWDVRGAGCLGATSVTDLDAAEVINIYPNPANDQLTIERTDIYEAQIVVTDILGNNISVSQKRYQDSAVIDLSGLASGMYLVRVGKSVKKFLKQ